MLTRCRQNPPDVVGGTVEAFTGACAGDTERAKQEARKERRGEAAKMRKRIRAQGLGRVPAFRRRIARDPR